MVEFKVNVNGVLIKRQWNWGTVVKVKDELKRMGFKWNPSDTTWVGKLSRINDVEKLRELLRLSASEYELIVKPLLKASIKVPKVPEEFKQCAMGNRVNVPCVAKLIMEDEYVEAESFEDYVTKLVGKAMEKLGVKSDDAVEEAVKILLNDHSLRETYGRRIEWRLAIVDNGKVTLNFLAKGLLKSLREIRIPYNTVDKQGNLNRYEIPVIGRDDVYRDGDKWIIRFPVFEKQTIESLLRKLGYVIKEVEWKPRSIPVPKDNVNLLDFQRNALEAWVKNGYKGTVVIPTGGGKTFIALKAIATVKVPTIILVVTEELMNQWHDRIRRMLGIEAGRLGGGFNEIKDVTVAIYNSAVKYIGDIRDRFDLAIFDECLPYDALVITDKGLIPIGEIVEKRLPVKVLTHKGRFMRITNYFKIPLVKRLVRITHEKGELTVTEDHLILTQNGWKPAIELRNGDLLYFYNTQAPQGRIQSGLNLREPLYGKQPKPMNNEPTKVATTLGDDDIIKDSGQGLLLINSMGNKRYEAKHDSYFTPVRVLSVNVLVDKDHDNAIRQSLPSPYAEHEVDEGIPKINPVTGIRGILGGVGVVYDIEVEEDHSFIADGVVVHNCHHVPAETFKNVAFKLTAPYRLALSATPTRKDGNEELIYLTSGGVVHKATYLDMVHAGLVVPIRHFRIYVKLSEDEVKEYRSIGEDNAIMLRNTAAQAKAKIPVTVQLTKLEYSLGSKVIVFTQYIEQAEEIYEELKKELGVKVALITSKTSNRDDIFERFRLGNVKVLVTTTVLDEGIDVPDADVAVVVSGTGSPRQMIQRVGRVVRQTEGKVEARVYEIIARNTIEEALSNERHPDDEVYEKECRKYDEKDLSLLLNRVKAIVSKLKEQGSMLKYVK
ncbi:helicase-related protein [Caldivirga maquilingensis]|uniref:Helicase domain protein n=1 Tax=Caldivirga maquilingensis (strain ATCC 700844 / DSM 13496 / JCM 10307 / IC-167) TaxID=397948 RepID=A8MD01_CALMQ|nr:helicase-related protein [Caldivirga maquilingensis]ABW01657.1 helicase domain protein [Caldivirga maquilingensis IC-167]